MAHPPLAIEISVDRVAGVRWTRAGSIESFAVEPLPAGVIVPSAVESNLLDISVLRTAFATVCGRLHAKDEDVAMLLPDPAIRVLVQHFEEFPRSPEAALPMLRWKLKKSIPFEVDETLISYMRQAPREHGVDVVIALARNQVVREYEALAEFAGLRAGVILSSSLAAVALLEARGIDGRGIELSREGVNRCVAKGLAVVQGDADTDLINYPDDAFDYVILSQTLQATRQPRVVLENLLRIGRRAIVSFPNFGFWKMRLQLLVGGHMPRTENLPATWYDTPNIHFCTIKDFVQLCDEINVKMERAVALDLYGRPLRLNAPWWFWNMFGEQGVFLLSRAGKSR